MSIAAKLADRLWNPWLLGLFLLVGSVYSFGSGFFQLFGLRLWLRATLGTLIHPNRQKRGGISPVQALATALASTIGTGSIAGVATALTLGGPGSVFWMWVSAILGMMTGCGEKLLAIRYQRPAAGGGLQGGPMFYLRDGVGSPILATWFALICLPATLVGGNLIQSSSIAAALESAWSIPRAPTGLVLLCLTALIMLGGLGRIAHVSSALVPIMALLYLGCGIVVLVDHAASIPSTFRLIVSCALCPQAALGGGAGWSVASALRYGVARGVFTNEAGLGTSAMAHGAAETDHPAQQGMWGIFEVCLSTLLVCTVTALVILTSGVSSPDSPLTGAPLTAAAFSSTLGPAGAWITALSLLLFAFSSILGWSYYGQQCLLFLSGSNRLLPAYRCVFLLCILLGAVWDSTMLWQWLDLFNALMAIPNLFALLWLSPEALSCLHTWTVANPFPSKTPKKKMKQKEKKYLTI